MKVVAKKYFLNQSVDHTATNIFTSTEGGDYVVGVYLSATAAAMASASANGGFGPTANILWTDENLSLLFPVNLSCGYGYALTGYPMSLVRLTPGGSVQATITGGGAGAGNAYPYDAIVVVFDLSTPGF